MNLISSQGVIDVVRQYCIDNQIEDGDYHSNGIEYELNNLPSAQRKGNWVYLYDGNYKCSECGSWWSCEDTPIESGMNFCPNCGAKMEGSK